MIHTRDIARSRIVTLLQEKYDNYDRTDKNIQLIIEVLVDRVEKGFKKPKDIIRGDSDGNKERDEIIRKIF